MPILSFYTVFIFNLIFYTFGRNISLVSIEDSYQNERKGCSVKRDINRPCTEFMRDLVTAPYHIPVAPWLLLKLCPYWMLSEAFFSHVSNAQIKKHFLIYDLNKYSFLNSFEFFKFNQYIYLHRLYSNMWFNYA